MNRDKALFISIPLIFSKETQNPADRNTQNQHLAKYNLS
jgi:hypothetical protein